MTGERATPSGVIVESQIIKANGEPVKVDYMMRRNGDSWLIAGIILTARSAKWLPADQNSLPFLRTTASTV